jgi:preprotein translocase subunit SecY
MSVVNAIKEVWEMEDLRKRIAFTLAMIGVYRLGVFVPVPGIDRIALAEWLGLQSGTLFGVYDVFSGGALSQYSVFFLGIMPYITASIVMQLLSEMVPTLKRIKEEGQPGQNRISQYSRYLTIVIAGVQSFTIAVGTESAFVPGSDVPVVLDAGFAFRAMTMLTMTAGAGFVMWLGEQITDRGVGNGSSVLITSGIVAGMPAGAVQLFAKTQNGEMSLLDVVALTLFMFAVVFGIVFVEKGQRRVALRHVKRVVRDQVLEGQTTYLPLKVNTAGVVPPIFASSLLMFPATVGQFVDVGVVQWLTGALQPGRWLYNFVYVVCVVFFAFFYTAITFNPEDVADNLKKQGAFIARVRPGRETAVYLDWLLTRLTSGGSLYLAVVCVLPAVLISSYGVPFSFGGTSLLILVGVSLDTTGQIRAALSTKHYSSLVGGGVEQRVRNRRRGADASDPWSG